MPPKSSQPSDAKSQKKLKSSSSRINTLKFDLLPPSSSPGLKRFNPLTAFTKPPVFEINGEPISPHDVKGKGKAEAKSTATRQIRNCSTRDDRLWVDRYEPTTEDELAVHHKKVEDVRRWLSEALDGGPSGKLKKYRRILAMTGPAGTAKTTTIRVLAREMGFEILEWRDAVGERLFNDSDDTGITGSFERPWDYYQDHEALISKFQAFLARASTCQNIFVTPISGLNSNAPHPSSQFSPPSQSQSQFTADPTHAQTPSRKRQVILLEDLPNILHPYTQSQFHASLQSLVDSPPSSPVVIIVSDAGMRGEASDERMANGGGWGKDKDGVVDIRTVLSRGLLGGPYVTQIGFNPIAPTLLRKALQALLNTHFSSPSSSSSSGTATVAPPSKDFLDIIVESANGDIRSAVMALQFACVVELPRETKGKGRKKIVKEGGGGARVVLEAVTRREQSLALFHLIGKVMYNKRKGDPPNPSATTKDIQKEKDLDAQLKDPPKVPWFLNEHERRASRVNVDTLYADSPIDSSLFSLYIQQNYSQFCNDIDECEGIADWLSWVDSSGGEAWYQANPHRFHLLTLGTLHSLPSPVVRRSQKLFKPDFFDVLKKEKDAWDGVRDVRGWIVTEGLDQEALGCRWSRADIAMELGGVLKARDAMHMPNTPPASHRLFSNLVFKYGTDAVGGTQQLGEGDVDEEPVPEQRERGDWSNIAKPCGGWLDSDDIEDF